MTQKKTDNCCRFCRHRGWGKTRKYQMYDGIVCMARPKVFRHAVDNIEPHFYSTTMTRTCENFERKEK